MRAILFFVMFIHSSYKLKTLLTDSGIRWNIAFHLSKLRCNFQIVKPKNIEDRRMFQDHWHQSSGSSNFSRVRMTTGPNWIRSRIENLEMVYGNQPPPENKEHNEACNTVANIIAYKSKNQYEYTEQTCCQRENQGYFLTLDTFVLVIDKTGFILIRFFKNFEFSFFSGSNVRLIAKEIFVFQYFSDWTPSKYDRCMNGYIYEEQNNFFVIKSRSMVGELNSRIADTTPTFIFSYDETPWSWNSHSIFFLKCPEVSFRTEVLRD